MVYDYIQDTLKATLENGCSQRYPHHWISRSSSALAATMPQLDMLCLRFSNPKKTGKNEKLSEARILGILENVPFFQRAVG